MESVSGTRQSIKELLEFKFPQINWISGRLPDAAYDPVKTLGSISTGAEVQQANDFTLFRTIFVQVYLPISLNQGNFTLNNVADPAEIEDLATDIINALAEVEDSPNGSWYYRWQRTDYPDDPNQQQTRAQMQFVAWTYAPDQG